MATMKKVCPKCSGDLRKDDCDIYCWQCGFRRVGDKMIIAGQSNYWQYVSLVGVK